ncbi:MAG: LD-carboxypeptidase [Polyangiaceae bacterium]|nr:LD-carboxypeptidase [Polyangiaceae bacterium]
MCAPSSPAPRTDLFRGLAWLALRYRLRLTSRVIGRCGYLAATDAERAEDFARAMLDPDISAIVCSRGGYGAMRILDELPWDAFARAPKWIVGFSDVTALHAVATAHGIASIHGPNVTGLGRSITPMERQTLICALERTSKRRCWSGLTILSRGLSRGRAAGPLVGGNLALMAAMAAAGRLVIPPGAILMLEDVTERPYRIDRMLTALGLGDHLARAGAIVFGSFTQCEPAPDGVTVADVLAERTRDLHVPVVMDAPFGHGAPNEAFVVGSVGALEDDALFLR